VGVTAMVVSTYALPRTRPHVLATTEASRVCQAGEPMREGIVRATHGSPGKP